MESFGISGLRKYSVFYSGQILAIFNGFCSKLIHALK